MDLEQAGGRLLLAMSLAAGPAPVLAQGTPRGPDASAASGEEDDPMKLAEKALDEAASEDRIAEARRTPKGKADARKAASRYRREALALYDRAWREKKEPTALYLSAALFYLLKQPIAAAESARRFLAVADGNDSAQKALLESANQMLLGGLRAADDAVPDPEEALRCHEASLGFRKGILRVDDPVRDRFILLRDGIAAKAWKSVCVVDPDDPSGVGAASDGFFWTGVGLMVVAAAVGVLGGALVGTGSNNEDTDAAVEELVDRVEFGSGLLIGSGILGLAGLGLTIGGLTWEPSGAAPAREARGSVRAVGIGGRF